MKNINIATAETLETVCQALAEGEHDLGDDATTAGNQLLGWTGVGCPWFEAHPQHLGAVVEIAPFDGFDTDGSAY
jgi:hypothetical protein